MNENRYGVKIAENTVVDLIHIRSIVKRRGGSVLRYSMALEREAYAPDRLVAWQGRFNDAEFILRQESGEDRAEFVRRFERGAFWK